MLRMRPVNFRYGGNDSSSHTLFTTRVVLGRLFGGHAYPGMSGTQLQRQMGCSYKTAWYLLHRLRRSMVNESRSLLRERVEADEVIIGGPVRGKTGRGVTKDEKSTLVFGAVEVNVYTDKHGCCMEKAGRLRLAVTQRADAVSIRKFLTTHVQTGSKIYTDGWKGYSQTASLPPCITSTRDSCASYSPCFR